MRKSVAIFSLFCALVVISTISACAAFEDPSQRATENAQSTALWTLVYDFQTQKPTLEAIAQTADGAAFFATRLAQINDENNNLRATNAALLANPASSGGVPTAIGGGQPAGSIPTSNVFSSSAGSVPTQVVRTSTPIPANTSNTNVSGVTSSGVRFSGSLTGTDIDDFGCVTGIQNTFAQSVESVYFATTALNVTQGVAFSLRIKDASDGRTVASDPNFWVADDVYDETCIWYNIDRSTMVFNQGTYTIELLADGEVGASVTFLIAAAAATTPTTETTNQ